MLRTGSAMFDKKRGQNQDAKPGPIPVTIFLTIYSLNITVIAVNNSLLR